MMVVLRTGLTQEESKRFRKYTDIVIGCRGRTDTLTDYEQQDMQKLLKKAMLVQSLFNESELNSHFGKEIK